jgi:hypothetical protein
VKLSSLIRDIILYISLVTVITNALMLEHVMNDKLKTKQEMIIVIVDDMDLGYLTVSA